MKANGEIDAVVLDGPLHAPESVAEVGVHKGIIEDLALKTLYLSGPMSLRELAAKTRLRFSVVDEVLRRLRAEQLCEITGMTLNIPQIAMTSAGKARALELLSLSQYAGAAPVSLESYVLQVRQQSVRDMQVHPPEVQSALADLVLEADTVRKLGTALNSGTSIFLYGPTGGGKSTIAAALSRVFGLDEIWIPYAVEVDGQIISVYDPHVHSKIAGEGLRDEHDPRWVRCRRPTVIVGGELTIEMLELQYNPSTKFYTAPVQMKANDGILIIDDFGRQRLRPEELLNRWVVPLDRRIDFLTLAGGKKVEIPFELFVVFATNLDPSTLADAAFLRRIQTKIKVGTVTEEQFRQIFRWVCSEAGLPYHSDIIDEVIQVIQNNLNEPLRACHPRDIVNQILWAARYEQQEPSLNRESLMNAIEAYFVRDSTPNKVM